MRHKYSGVGKGIFICDIQTSSKLVQAINGKLYPFS